MMHVLIVDDEMGIRTLLAEILEDDGFYVSMAENAEQARQLVNERAFDLILLDIWMPGTDGISLLKEWHAAQQCQCPIVIMSGHGSIETAMEATRFGAKDFLEKPISQQKLLSTCHRALKDWQVTKVALNLQPKSPVVKPPSTVTTPPERVEGTPAESPASPGSLTLTPLTNGVVNMPAFAFGDQPLPVITLPLYGVCLDFSQSFRVARDNFERAYLTRVLMMKKGSVTELSAHAGLERTHLYRKLRSLGIDASNYKLDSEKPTKLEVFGPGEDEIQTMTYPVGSKPENH